MRMQIRWVLYATIGLAVLAAVLACGEGIVNGWPTFTIEGTVRSAQGAPAPMLGVEARVWTDPGGCDSESLHQLLTTSTNSAGAYQVTVTTPTSTFSGCVRVTAGQSSVTRDLDQVMAGARVRIDVQLP